MAEVYTFRQNSTSLISFVLFDEAGNRIDATSLGTLLCTYYYTNPQLEYADRYHLQIINGRNNQNIKNANNVSVSASGTVEWTLQPEDNVKLDANTAEEIHTALFTWYWSNQHKKNNVECTIKIRRVPYSL